MGSVDNDCTSFGQSICHTLNQRTASAALFFGTHSQMHCIWMQAEQSFHLLLHSLVPYPNSLRITAIAAKNTSNSKGSW